MEWHQSTTTHSRGLVWTDLSIPILLSAAHCGLLQERIPSSRLMFFLTSVRVGVAVLHWAFSENETARRPLGPESCRDLHGFQGCQMKTQVKLSPRCPPARGLRGMDNCVFWHIEKLIPLLRREGDFSYPYWTSLPTAHSPGESSDAKNNQSLYFETFHAPPCCYVCTGHQGYLGHNLGHAMRLSSEGGGGCLKSENRAGIWTWPWVSPNADDTTLREERNWGTSWWNCKRKVKMLA